MLSGAGGAAPFLFGVGLTSFKTALADVWTQRVVEHRPLENFDLRRVSIFALYGLLYLGVVQYALWAVLFPRLFPSAAAFAALPFAAKLRDGAGQRAVLGQLAIDQGLHWPFAAIPAFHVMKGLGERRSVLASLRSCRAVWLSDVKACWAVWIPAGLINFGLMPIALRVPFAAFVSFGYTAFVSYRRGAPLAEAGEGVPKLGGVEEL